jgi:1,4-alpha-glucan branching enzyme
MTPKLTFNPDVIMQIDPWLEPFLPALSDRHAYFDKVKHDIESSEGSFDAFSQGYKKFGLNVKDDGSVVYHEWAPNAVEASLIGDFSTSYFMLDLYPH